MGNVLRVFWRDVKRIAKVPQAWSVVLFLIVLPSLYTWFNVAGFWNPYDNTGNLRVCVVNEDAGVDDEMLGQLDLGSQIVQNLEENDQLGFEFVTKDEATRQVESGEAYAAFVIPESFSADIATIVSDDFKQPTLEYYVNEKKGPVSPKITDTGANVLDTTINETFVSVVSSTVAQVVGQKIDEVSENVQGSKNKVLNRMDEARGHVESVRTTLGELSTTAQDAKPKVQSARQTLESSKAKLDVIATKINGAADLVSTANTGIVTTSGKLESALDESSSTLSAVSTTTSTAVNATMDKVLEAKGVIDEAIGVNQRFTNEYAEVVDTVTNAVNSLMAELGNDALTEDQRAKIDAALARLTQGASGAAGVADELAAISNQLGQAAATLSEKTTDTNASVQDALANVDAYRNSVATETVPALSTSLAGLSSSFGTLSSSVSSQKALVDESISALGQLERTLDATTDAVGQTTEALGTAQDELGTLRNDLASLEGASRIDALVDEGVLDPAQIAEFMMSPTKVETVKLYALNAYGSAMAPLFINLTLWIGVFMLMVIIRNEVDDEGIARLTMTQRYFGRGLLLAIIASLQAAVCVTGCLAMGVQSASVPAFYFTAIVASLVYLSIQYTLSSTFQHIGKALCVVLVFVQIPGATGLYPIEMTPDFFQMVYPFFPFTYGINAIRETIGGFYGSLWSDNLLALVGFLVAFVVVGVVVRPFMTNLNRMFARQIDESDIVIGEASVLPARRYRYTQVLKALSDRDEYREQINARVTWFVEHYSLFKKLILCFGIVVPIITTTIMTFFGAEKVVILTSWLIWFLVVIGVAIALDFAQDNLSHQLSLESMTDDEVRTLYSGRQSYTQVKALRQHVVANTSGDDRKAVRVDTLPAIREFPGRGGRDA